MQAEVSGECVLQESDGGVLGPEAVLVVQEDVFVVGVVVVEFAMWGGENGAVWGGLVSGVFQHLALLNECRMDESCFTENSSTSSQGNWGKGPTDGIIS